MINIKRQVQGVINVLDKERRTGFVDEHAILHAWADSLVGCERSAHSIGHKEAVARAELCERAFDEITSNPSLSKQKILIIAKNALRRARNLKGRVS